MHVLHRCDNTSCVNPEHLFLGTHLDNMRDMYSKGRRKAAAKLSESQKETIRLSSETGVALAAVLGVSGARVCQIRRAAAAQGAMNHG